jgi:hypothetical protein
MCYICNLSQIMMKIFYVSYSPKIVVSVILIFRVLCNGINYIYNKLNNFGTNLMYKNITIFWIVWVYILVPKMMIKMNHSKSQRLLLTNSSGNLFTIPMIPKFCIKVIFHL